MDDNPKMYSTKEGALPMMRVLRVIDTDDDTLTIIEGAKHPYRGAPYPEIIVALNPIKAFLRVGMRALLNPLVLIGYLISMKQNKKALVHLVKVTDVLVVHFAQYRLSRGSRELMRVFSDNSFFGLIARLLIYVWEYDSAYRYRGQFLLHLLGDKTYTLTQAIDECIKREKNSSLLPKWKQFRIMSIFVTKKMVNNFIYRFYYHRVAPDILDMYWMKMSKGFNFKM